jgi:hypothetical protein
MKDQTGAQRAVAVSPSSFVSNGMVAKPADADV